jgi:tetratricopeptide (TPR) repeat protein
MVAFHSSASTSARWVAAGLLLAACGGAASDELEAPRPPGVSSQAEPVSLDKSQDYKAEQVRLAMRGIKYTGGVLAIDAEVAPSIVSVQDPTASAAALAEGRALIELNRRDEAVAVMTRAVLLAPESAAAYEGLGEALTVRRKDVEAAAAFRAGLERDPAAASLHHKLGDSLVRVDRRAEALAEFRRALELEQAHAAARERLALQLYYTGEPAEAWAEVHSAEALGQTVPPQFRALLARAYPEPTAEEK